MRLMHLRSAICLTMLCLLSPAMAQRTGGLADRAFDRLDRNQDGSISKDELPERAQAMFSRVDSDGDGALTRGEFSRTLQSWRDRNNPESRSQPPAGKPAPDPYRFYGSADQRLEIDRIEQATLKLDDSENPLQLRITFPKQDGPFPVIVFSHGLFGTNDHYLMLTEFWASHGYVVIQPNHPDSMALGTRFGDFTATRCWAERPQQVSAVFDSLDQLVKQHPQLKGKMNDQRMGVGGHSFGAGTANLLAGAKVSYRRWGSSLADERIKAALLMSPQGEGDILNRQSWEQMKTPFMVLTGSKDESVRTKKSPSWRRQPYELAPSRRQILGMGRRFESWIW